MGSGDGSSETSKISKQPKYSRFTQQELPACKPILTPGMVIGILISLAIIFIPIGLTSFAASESVVEVVDRYDEDCIRINNAKEPNEERIKYVQSATTNKTCIRTLTVPKKMKKPIYVYYQLDNFYQNHRRYVKSRSDHQLLSPKDEKNTKLCEPEALGNNNQPIIPCGLIAWSLFNDTFKFLRKGNTALEINKKGIAWKSDKEKKFGSNVYPKNFQSTNLVGGANLNKSIPLSEQEDLIVWMRTAALPSFRKLYGKIETDLEADEKLTVVIQNNYNTYLFDGKKKVVLSTASWIGGKNDFLGKTYIGVGGASLFLGIAFTILYILKPRPLGDPSYLSWNKSTALQ